MQKKRKIVWNKQNVFALAATLLDKSVAVAVKWVPDWEVVLGSIPATPWEPFIKYLVSEGLENELKWRKSFMSGSIFRGPTYRFFLVHRIFVTT